ncbi:MAG: cell division protein FtsZ [Hyphomicrobiales bacterium]
MTINLKMPDITELKPKITVFGVGGAGGNAVNNMIKSGLEGVEFVVANTDAQALTSSNAERLVQMGLQVTQGLGAGSQPEVGRQAAEEVIDELNGYLEGSHMAFITAGMGGGTGTGAAPVVARAARDMGILTVGVVTKPFQFEGARRMRLAEQGIEELQANVDTLIVIPNQNLFRVANDKTTFADAFSMADQVLYSGVACITDLMVKEGLINLDFADVRSVMSEMGKAMMGTGEASGENRATEAAEAAIANPLLDETSMQGAQGLLISITGGNDLTLFEVDEAATRIREEVDQEANIILGATFDEALEGVVRVSVVATGIEHGVSSGELPEVKEASTFMRPITTSASLTAEASSEPVVADSSIEPVVAATVEEHAAPAAQPQASIPSAQPEVHQAELAQPETVQPQVAPVAVAQPETAKTDAAVTISPFTPSEDALQLAQSSYDVPVMDDLDAVMAVTPVADEQVSEAPFIPPLAEAPVVAQKMPSVDDFPMIVREEIKAKSVSSLEISDDEERGALGLLKRITNATLGGRKDYDDEMENEAEMPVAVPQTATIPITPEPVAPAAPQSVQARPAQPQAVAPSDPTPSSAPSRQSVATNYAPATGNLDAQGRVSPTASATSAEEQLEIPAFLRRQAQ